MLVLLMPAEVRRSFINFFFVNCNCQITSRHFISVEDFFIMTAAVDGLPFAERI
jgi:hypothetical protein